MPAPPGNKNAFRHGLRTIAMLPKDCAWVKRRLAAFRNCLEDACTAAHGEIDLVRGAGIQTVLRWEQVAILAGRWLREANDELTSETKLNFAKMIAQASENRDRALARLDLGDKRDVDPWDVLSAPVTSEATHEPPDGGCGGNGCQGGCKCQSRTEAMEADA